MKSVHFVFVFLMCTFVFGSEYPFDKKLTLSGKGLEKLEINCGAGFLIVNGKSALDEINVSVEIIIEGVNEERAKKIVQENFEFTLEKHGSRAVLTSKFTNSSFFSSLSGLNKLANLTVNIPSSMNLDIDDGSGNIEIAAINGNIKLKDGSGAVEIDGVKGNLDIVDGSGDISIFEVKGSLDLDDGSGSVQLENVSGNVDVDDGSGGIEMKKMGGDVKIHDGSGEIVVRDVAGNVKIHDGLGSISVNGVQKDVVITESGSGSVTIKNVDGKIFRDD